MNRTENLAQTIGLHYQADLAKFAEKIGVGPDWHEPDEVGVGARIVGDHLDNAFGARITGKAITEGFQEFVVVIEKGGVAVGAVNLADLLAWASEPRKA